MCPRNPNTPNQSPSTLLSLACFLLLFPFQVQGQEEVFENFGNVDIWKGLATKEVIDVEEDSLGFIWLATWSGLARFDGYSCTYFPICSPTGEQNFDIVVNCLFTDSAGKLWVGTDYQGLYYKEKWDVCLKGLAIDSQDFSDRNLSVFSIAEDAKRRIWFSLGEENGVFVYDPKANTIKHIPISDGQSTRCVVYNLVYDSVHHKIIGILNDRKIVEINENDFAYHTTKLLFDIGGEVGDVHVFNSLSISHGGVMWVASDQRGVGYYSRETSQWVEFRPDLFHGKRVTEVRWLADRQCYILVDGDGIYQFSPDLKRYRHYAGNTYQALEETVFRNVALSANGDLWVCGEHTGAEVHYAKKIQSRSILNMSSSPGLAMEFPILSIHPAGNGEYWIGTDGHGLFKYSRKDNSFTPVVIGKDNPKIIRTIYTDSKGKVWFGHLFDGITTYYPKTNKWERIRQLANKQIWNGWTFLEDKKGNMWISTLNDGLIRLNTDGTLTYYTPKLDESTIFYICAMTCDKDNNLWLGFTSNGVGKLQTNTMQLQEYTPSNSGLSSNSTSTIFEDKNGNIWVGTSAAGLNLWRNGRFKVFTTQNGLLANDVRSVFMDSEGRMNLVSGIGVTRFRLDENDKMVDIAYVHTMAQNSFKRNSYLVESNGYILIGGNRGMLEINISQDQANRHESLPKVVISTVRTNLNSELLEGRNLLSSALKGEHISLPTGGRNVYLELTNNRVAYCDVTEYQYWLEGHNDGWSTLKLGNRQVAFENLTAGKHRLHLRCRNSFGQWGPETQVMIVVSLPFWETEWFMIGLISTVFAASMVALAMRNKSLRTEIRKQELEAEKHTLIREKEGLKEVVAEKDVLLLASSVEKAQKSELFNDIKDMLNALRGNNNSSSAIMLKKLTAVIEGEIKGDEEWESFKYYFDKVNLDFSGKLLKIQPALTPNDIRMAMLVRLNLSTKDIAKMLNITPMGVQKSRYRLKKRLGLEENNDLREFLQSLDER